MNTQSHLKHRHGPALGLALKLMGGKCGIALEAAALKGHDVVVRLLLEKGAVNTVWWVYGSVFQASSECHDAIIELLEACRGNNVY